MAVIATARRTVVVVVVAIRLGAGIATARSEKRRSTADRAATARGMKCRSADDRAARQTVVVANADVRLFSLGVGNV